MRRKLYISLFAALFAVFLSLSPLIAAPTEAFSLGDAASCIKDQQLGCVTDALGKVSVPSLDIVGAIKTVLNIAATTIAKKAIADMVSSTVTWANNGFEGNPAYVQNTRQFFLNSANSTAQTFIDQVGNGKLGFLCSPFQKQIQLSLIAYYYQPQNQVLQCTWTGVAGNFQNFIDSNFSAGGWDGWFSMTQIPTNNVYGATVSSELELSKQVQQTLGLKQQDYQNNHGFLNLPGDCLAHNPDFDTMARIANGAIDHTQYDEIDESSDSEQVANDQNDHIILVNFSKPASTASSSVCIYYGPTKTPGTIIESGLQKALGSGVDQLVNVQDFDQLASALMQGLLTRYVTGPKGLFGPHYNDGLPSSGDTDNGYASTTDLTAGATPPASTPQFSCAPIPSAVGINQPANWHVNASGLNPGDNVTYSWTWSTGGIASGNNHSISYSAPGTYTGSVNVNLNGTVQTVQCDTPLVVTSVPPPTVSCSPSLSSAAAGDTVTWTASVSGGSGALSSATWEDTSTSVPGDTSGESFSPSVITGTNISTSITYAAEGSRTASIVVHDVDPQFQPIISECTGSVDVGGFANQR